MVIIVVCNNLTLCIVLYKVLQFHIKNGCLNLIETAVATCILEDILALATIVSESTNGCCQHRIIGSNSTTITKSTKVLAWVERVTCSITNVTGYATIGMLTYKPMIDAGYNRGFAAALLASAGAIFANDTVFILCFLIKASRMRQGRC